MFKLADYCVKISDHNRINKMYIYMYIHTYTHTCMNNGNQSQKLIHITYTVLEPRCIHLGLNYTHTPFMSIRFIIQKHT